MENLATKLWIQISGLFEMQFESVPTKIFYDCFVKWYMLIQRVGHGKFCSNGSLEVEVWQLVSFFSAWLSVKCDNFFISIQRPLYNWHISRKHTCTFPGEAHSCFQRSIQCSPQVTFPSNLRQVVVYHTVFDWLKIEYYCMVFFQLYSRDIFWFSSSLIIATPLHNWHYCWQFHLHLKFSHYERDFGIWIVS